MNTDAPATILARYNLGERDFRDLELDDQCYVFAGCCLAGADFSGGFITADFRFADLRNVQFHNANVKTCDFRGANLEGANFQGAAIDGALFVGARLKGAFFYQATEQGHDYGAGELPTS